MQMREVMTAIFKLGTRNVHLFYAALTKTGCSGSHESLNFTNNLMREHAQRLQFTRTLFLSSAILYEIFLNGTVYHIM